MIPLLRVLPLLAFLLLAPLFAAAPAANADTLHRELREARDTRIPASVTRDERTAWYAAREDRISRLAERFATAFPADPRRWEALGFMATLRRTFEGATSAADQAAWEQRQAELRRQILAAAEAPEETVASVYLAELRPYFTDGAEGKWDPAAAEKLLADLAARFPSALSRAYAETTYLRALSRRDAAAGEAYARKLQGDPNPAVAKIGREKLTALALRRAPLDLQRTAFDGREVDFKKLRGKVVLIDFWATWCVPCMEQMPEIKRLYAQYRDQGLEVIGVTDDIPPRDPANPRPVEKTPAMLQAFLEKEGMPWPQIWDQTSSVERRGPKELLVLFGVSELPTTLLVDRQGRLHSVEGHGGGKLEAAIRRLLEGGQSATR
jgi:thiol-disulfide isomerase/thioredoxin